MRNIFPIIVGLLVCWFVGFTSPVHAETLNSSNYTIRMGNFNMTSGLKSSSSYSLTDTVGQIAAEFFAGTGYHVKAGFQYIYTLYDFSFALSSILVDLGTLSNGSFATASHTITVSAPGQGYSVTAYESTRLANENGDKIPDTTCDSGPCTETSASAWTSFSNYGFGYNLTGNDIATDFVNANYFRPFPDVSLGENPATIMTTTQAGKNRTATVNYKAAISSVQAAGNYSTQITYIATPSY